jgi:hypothetical protein
MNSTLMFYRKEKDKTINLLDKLDKLKLDNSKNLAYLIIKLQEVNLELDSTIEIIENNSNKLIQDNYIKNEFSRRDKMSELMPIFMYLYMSYK